MPARLHTSLPHDGNPARTRHPTALLWDHDPTLIKMALSLSAGNVGRAAHLLEIWQDGGMPIGRSENN